MTFVGRNNIFYIFTRGYTFKFLPAQNAVIVKCPEFVLFLEKKSPQKKTLMAEASLIKNTFKDSHNFITSEIHSNQRIRINMLRLCAQRTVYSTVKRVVKAPAVGACLFSSVKFAPTHEYVRIDGSVGTVGITDHAATALGDIVYVELPEVGRVVTAGESFGSVESVKAASDVYSPVTGEVVEINKVRKKLVQW